MECKGGTCPSATSSPPHQRERRHSHSGGAAAAHVCSSHVLCSGHDQHNERGYGPSPARPLGTTLSRGGGALPLYLPLATAGGEAAHCYGHLSFLQLSLFLLAFPVEDRRPRCAADPARCLSAPSPPPLHHPPLHPPLHLFTPLCTTPTSMCTLSASPAHSPLHTVTLQLQGWHSLRPLLWPQLPTLAAPSARPPPRPRLVT